MRYRAKKLECRESWQAFIQAQSESREAFHLTVKDTASDPRVGRGVLSLANTCPLGAKSESESESE